MKLDPTREEALKYLHPMPPKEVDGLHCMRCDYRWGQRGEEPPKKCPACYSRNWWFAAKAKAVVPHEKETCE